jgi:Holliday junction resolvase RusA-like endonuclease
MNFYKRKKAQMISFKILGDPNSKARHRTTTVNGFAKAYDPQGNKKKAFQWLLLAEIRKGTWNPLYFPHNGAIMLGLNFYLPLPKSWSKAKRTRFKADPGNAEFYCTTKPDLDNLEKFFLDCANKILYNDDCQVVRCFSGKQWSLTPCTEVSVTFLQGEDQ